MNQFFKAKELLLIDSLSDESLESILSNFSSVTDFLLSIGLSKGYYLNNNFDLRVNNVCALRYNNERYVKCEGISADKVSFNGHGDFIRAINRFNKQWLIKTHGFRVEKLNYRRIVYTYGPTTNFKALLMLYGEELLDYLDLSSNDLFLDGLRRRWEDLALDTVIDNLTYRGNAGSCVISSSSAFNNVEHNVRVMQPPVIDDKLVIEDNINFSCGCESWSRSNGVQREYELKIELCKHLTAMIIGLKKGRRFLEEHEHKVKAIERPEGVMIDNIPLLTLYEPLELPLLPDGSINPIFREVNSFIAEEYYVNNKPMRVVDYEVLNRFGELLLTPYLHIKLITSQVSFNERLNNTCLRSGAVIHGNDYITVSVRLPFPLAREGNYLFTFYPTRFKKIN